MDQAGKSVGDLVRALGQVFDSIKLYGADHSVTMNSLTNSHGTLTGVMESRPALTIEITEESLMAEGAVVELKNPLMKTFADHLRAIDINNLTFKQGMSLEEFAKLIDILNEKPEELKEKGGFSAVCAEGGLECIKATTVRYQQITEDEVVVSKEELKDTGMGEADAANIMAFLRGDIEEGDENALRTVKEFATDTEKLTEMILESAQIEAAQGEHAEDETLADVVVGCLKKAYTAMSSDGATKTQKGRKQLTKTLMLLEEQLLTKMKEMAADAPDEDIEIITDTIAEMKDELAIDSLATEYMKKRSAIDTNEQKILKYMKSKGLDAIEGSDLRDKLEECGLTPEGWHELVMRSGADRGGAGTGNGSGGGDGIGPGTGGMGGAIGHLAVLLESMESTMSGEGSGTGEGSGGESGEAAGAGVGEGPKGEELAAVMKDVDKEIKDLVIKTESKIKALVEEVQAEEAAEAAEGEGKPRKPVMSRKKLFEVLAEIGQELCQPLAVINCSLQMLASKALGDVNEQQVNMIQMAEESGQRLHELINRLMEISGVPDAMSPDVGITSALYE
ncbi:hypothetical protein BVX94_00305 [bacterium B17]|nr:hypothetical protein BVX94_00305 [bacterium B17]